MSKVFPSRMSPGGPGGEHYFEPYATEPFISEVHTRVARLELHSISSNRDSLIGTPLVSLEKYRDNSVFGGKNRGQAINKD